MKKQKFDFPVRITVIWAIILLAFFFVIGYIREGFVSLDFFTVKKVVVRNSDRQFDYLKGRNIFSLDLNSESRRAFLSCQDCRKVRFVRVLPDCIFVDFLKRKPFALVKFYKNFAVDEEGVLFYPGEAVDEALLPVIDGLETKIFAPKTNVKYKRVELDLALSIIKEFKANKIFQDFTLKRVDVGVPQSAGFFILLPGQQADFTKPVSQSEWIGFEVRTGQINIKQKMVILSGLIFQARNEWNNIKYIDLRFKEPVIKFKDKI